MFMKETGLIFLEKVAQCLFESRSQPSPPFKAHPLSFEQGSLHTGGLVAYRSLSIPGYIGWIMFLSGQIARNDYIDDKEPY